MGGIVENGKNGLAPQTVVVIDRENAPQREVAAILGTPGTSIRSKVRGLRQQFDPRGKVEFAIIFTLPSALRAEEEERQSIEKMRAALQAERAEIDRQREELTAERDRFLREKAEFEQRDSDQLPRTSRQREIVFSILDGLSDKEIAERFGLAIRTVKGLLMRAYRQFGIPALCEDPSRLTPRIIFATSLLDRGFGERRPNSCKPLDQILRKKRQFQIVELIRQGYTNRAIAQVLGTSEQVIKNYNREILDMVGVDNRLQLALLAHDEYLRNGKSVLWHAPGL